MHQGRSCRIGPVVDAAAEPAGEGEGGGSNHRRTQPLDVDQPRRRPHSHQIHDGSPLREQRNRSVGPAGIERLDGLGDDAVDEPRAALVARHQRAQHQQPPADRKRAVRLGAQQGLLHGLRRRMTWQARLIRRQVARLPARLPLASHQASKRPARVRSLSFVRRALYLFTSQSVSPTQ